MDSKSALTPRLVIIEGPDKGRVIPLHHGTVVIGRSKGDIVIQDPRISRSHISLEYQESSGRLSFTDLNSLNGTLVNGQPVQSGDLQDGDQLQVGSTVFDCQTAATEKKKKPSSKKRPAAKREEPKLVPLEDEGSDEPLETPRTVERPTLVWRAKEIYAKVPPRYRYIGLGLILFIAILPRGGKNGGDKEGFQRDFASVRKLESQGKIEEALSKAKDLTGRYTENAELYALMGDLYVGQKKNELAIAAYQKAGTLKPAQPLVPVKLIRLYLKSGLVAEAERELAHVDELMRTTRNRDLIAGAAQLFMDFKELKQPPEKLLQLAEALQTELAPDDSIGYRLEASVQFQQNRIPAALAALERGQKIAPNDEWILENLAFAKLSLKEYHDATVLIERWLQLRPDNPRALIVMSYLKLNDKNFEGAAPFAQRLVQILQATPDDPIYPEALFLMGQISVSRAQANEAKNFFSMSCDKGYQQSCQILRNLPTGHP